VRKCALLLLETCLLLVGCGGLSDARYGAGGTPNGLLMRYTTGQPATKTFKALTTKTPVPASPITEAANPVSTLAETPTPALPRTTAYPLIDQLCSPLENVDLKDLPRLISDGYRPPPKGSDERHQGVDFAYYHWKGKGPIEGTEIHSVLPGMVAVSEQDSYPFGNVVVIETQRGRLPPAIQEKFWIDEGYSLYALYGHMKAGSPVVTLGEEISSCETIGFVGKTGNTQAAHLHFEVRVGPAGLRLDGFSLYIDTATELEKKNYRLWSISGEYLTFDPMKLLLFQLSQNQ
jgi:murein DD-endopeptidase MepM/ murein hydrolase activator NlpD